MNECYLAASQASRIAKYQSSGYDARSLISPEPEEAVYVQKPLGTNKKVKKERNYQAHNRRQLLDMQRQTSRRLSAEKETEIKLEKKKNLRKQKDFGHVRSSLHSTKKVFQDLSSEQESTLATESTISSSMGSLSLSSMESIVYQKVGSAELSGSTSTRKKGYGKVPSYILKRRIMDVRKQQQDLSIVTNDARKATVEIEPMTARIKDSDRRKLIADLEVRENEIKSSLRSLPFGLQSSGSIKKRERIECELKEVEEEKKMLSKKTWF